jgi:hypothetical protein
MHLTPHSEHDSQLLSHEITVQLIRRPPHGAVCGQNGIARYELGEKNPFESGKSVYKQSMPADRVHVEKYSDSLLASLLEVGRKLKVSSCAMTNCK